jgi:hypothetical protein
MAEPYTAANSGWGDSSQPASSGWNNSTAPAPEWGKPAGPDAGWGSEAPTDTNQFENDPAPITTQPTEPEVIKMTKETVNDLNVYLVVDSQCFQDASQASLCSRDPSQMASFVVNINSRHKVFPSSVVFVVKAKLSEDPSINMRMTAWHYIELKINAADMSNIQRTELAADSTLPDSFILPPGFDPTGKTLVSFVSNRAFLWNAHGIPPMQNRNEQPVIEGFVKKMQSHIDDKNPHEYSFIVRNDVATQGFLNRLIAAAPRDKAFNPYWLWIDNSPAQHQLRQGNIKQALARPMISQPKWIVPERAIGDRIGFLVRYVYALTDERNLALSRHLGLAKQYSIALMEVKGSRVKVSDIDNDLPKMYIASIQFGEHIRKPKEGTTLIFHMPYPVPDCPECTGPKKRTFAAADFNDDIGFHESGGGEIVIGGMTAEDKAEMAQDNQDANAASQIKMWYGQVQAANPCSPPGEVSVSITRPIDGRWDGKNKADAPTVGTEIPATKTEFRNLAKAKQYLQSPFAKRVMISVEQPFSDQLSVKLNQHTAEYLACPNASLPYKEIHLASYIPQDINELTKSWLPDHQAALKKFFDKSYWRHGISLFEGVTGSGKSFLVQFLGLLLALNNHKGIVVCGENNLVDQWAQKLVKAANQLREDFPDAVFPVQEVKVCRVHAWETEKKTFMNEHDPHESRAYFEEGAVCEFLYEQMINDLGRKAAHNRSKLDPRFVIKNQSLSQHMQDYLTKHQDEDQWSSLITKMANKRENPEDSTNNTSEISALIEELRVATLSSVHIVVTTCGQAIRSGFGEKYQPIWFTKDEDPKSPLPEMAAVVAAFPSLDFGTLVGDGRQNIPYSDTCQDGTVVAFFALHMRQNAFTYYRQGGNPVIYLAIQLRMQSFKGKQGMVGNAKYVAWFSKTRYNGSVIDGFLRHLSLAQPNSINFIMKAHKSMFGIASTCIMVLLEGSWSKAEEGGTSIGNMSMQLWCLETYIKGLYRRLKAEKQFPVNPEEWSVMLISPYLAVTTWIKQAAELEVRERLFSADVFEVIQGLDKHSVLKVEPRKKLGEFCSGIRPARVSGSRHKFSYVAVYAAEAFVPATYHFKNEDQMIKCPDTKVAWEEYQFFSKEKLIFRADAPETRACKQCQQIGHEKDDCKNKPVCANCFVEGHSKAQCTEINTLEFKGNCTKCGEPGHKKKDCLKGKGCKRCKENHPTSECNSQWCKLCRTIEHDYNACPHAQCTNCGGAHWKTNPECPYFSKCYKCGAKHSATFCTAQNASLLFPTFSKMQKTNLDVAAEQLHKELNPSEKIEYEDGYVPEQVQEDADPVSDSDDEAITPPNSSLTTTVPTTQGTALPNAQSAAVLPTALPAALPKFVPTGIQNNTEWSGHYPDRYFPSGFLTIPTSGSGLLCGLRAIEGSLLHQLANMQTPTLAELQHLATTGEVADRIAEIQGALNEEFHNNFLVDQLAAVVEELGARNGHRLKLGVLYGTRAMIVYSGDMTEDTTVLWIHNSDSDGTSGFGHYSAIKSNFNFSDPPVEKYDPTITIKELLGQDTLEDHYDDAEVCTKCFASDHVTADCELSSDFELSEAQLKELEESRLPAGVEIVIKKPSPPAKKPLPPAKKQLPPVKEQLPSVKKPAPPAMKPSPLAKPQVQQTVSFASWFSAKKSLDKPAPASTQSQVPSPSPVDESTSPSAESQVPSPSPTDKSTSQPTPSSTESQDVAEVLIQDNAQKTSHTGWDYAAEQKAFKNQGW